MPISVSRCKHYSFCGLHCSHSNGAGGWRKILEFEINLGIREISMPFMIHQDTGVDYACVARWITSHDISAHEQDRYDGK